MEITLTALALIPGILIVIYIFRKDEVEKEPVPLLIKLVIFGSISCIPALFLETAVSGVCDSYPEGTIEYALLNSFLSAGLMEETCKFALLRLGSWKNKAFDYRFDGIVYGVCVACGFAMLENVLYVLEGGVSVAVTRAFLSVPLHAFCGAFMGAFYGMAKYKSVRGQHKGALSCRLGALLVPITIHGIYDTLCFVDWEPASVILIGYVIILYILGIKIINSLAEDDINMCFYRSSSGYDFVPSYDYEQVHSQKLKVTNNISKASLICGIISFISASSFMLPAFLAVIFGIAGKRKSGKGSRNSAASTGLVLGIISLVFNIYIAYMSFSGDISYY